MKNATNNGLGRIIAEMPDDPDPVGANAYAQQTPIITDALRDYCEAACRFDQERDEDSREWKLAQAAFHASYEALMGAIDTHTAASVRQALSEALSGQE